MLKKIRLTFVYMVIINEGVGNTIVMLYNTDGQWLPWIQHSWYITIVSNYIDVEVPVSLQTNWVWNMSTQITF
jgi:hypothetical protein